MAALAADDRASARGLDQQGAGPTVPRMVLGAQLRRLREARSISREAAGEAIRASASKISRLELGRTGFKIRDVADLLTLYGVTEEADRATPLALVKASNAPAWWHEYNNLVPTWLHPYLGLEQAATVIRSYEVQYVPGLLQTADYARAVIRLGNRNASAADIERLVELRMKRQGILHQGRVPHLWVVIDETALRRRPPGAPATMRSQIRHLLEMSELPHITVQIMPFNAGSQILNGNPVTILRPPGGELPDVVYLERLKGASYPSRPIEIERYRHLMNRLVVDAEQPLATRALLSGILRET